MEVIMVVTATQFKANIGHYLDTVTNNDVYISKNGKMVAKLSDPMNDKMSILNALAGIIPNENIDLEEIKMERIMRKLVRKGEPLPDFLKSDELAVKVYKELYSDQ